MMRNTTLVVCLNKETKVVYTIKKLKIYFEYIMSNNKICLGVPQKNILTEDKVQIMLMIGWFND